MFEVYKKNPTQREKGRLFEVLSVRVEVTKLYSCYSLGKIGLGMIQRNTDVQINEVKNGV